MLQKIVNGIAIASGVVSLTVIGLGGYVFIRKDAISIRQEFAEWLLREDKEIHHEIVSLEYMGEESEFDK